MPQTVIYASAARTATPAAIISALPRNTKAVRLVFDVTAVTSTPSTTITVDVVDSLSGKAVNLLTSAAIATVTTTVFEIGLGVTAATNLAANKMLGDSIRITMTHGNANSMTASLSLHTIR